MRQPPGRFHPEKEDDGVACILGNYVPLSHIMQKHKGHHHELEHGMS